VFRLLLLDKKEEEGVKVKEIETEQNDIMDASELAALLRVNVVTVRLKASAGVIPGRQIGNRWRFSRTRIIQWMESA
jgi:excisionase family DNA binding protein